MSLRVSLCIFEEVRYAVVRCGLVWLPSPELQKPSVVLVLVRRASGDSMHLNTRGSLRGQRYC